jgi:hypothetical protein
MHHAAKAVTLLSLIVSLLSLITSFVYFARKLRCLGELNRSLPIMRLAAKKYLNHSDTGSSETKAETEASQVPEEKD